VSKKVSSLRLIGVAGILTLLLTACLSVGPIAFISHGPVTGLAISGPAVIHSDCTVDEDTNPITFKISITTNAPATVTYHIEVYNSGRTMLLDQTPNTNLVFTSAATQTIDSGDMYRNDCGTFIIKLIVTAPNSMTAQTTWSVVNP
jgi:hypothetical protein